MKESNIPPEILSAGPCLIGECRGGLVDQIGYVDKKDGKAKDFVKLSYLFEIGSGNSIKSVRVDMPLPKTITDPNQVKVELKRGQRYLLQLQSLKTDRGNTEARLVAGSKPFAIEA